MARTRRPRLAAVAAVAALCGLAPTACGGEAPGEVVARTQANLARIRSGDLDARLVIAAEGPKRTGATGFELHGPFELPRSAGDLPKARIAYTQIAGSRRATVTLVSTGERAYIEVRGKAYELTPDQERQLREAGGPLGGGSGSGAPGATASPTGSLDLAAWLREPDLSGGGSIGGAETDRVTGEVDVASVVTDVLGAAERLGVSGEAAGGRSAARSGRRAARPSPRGELDRVTDRPGGSPASAAPARRQARRKGGGRGRRLARGRRGRSRRPRARHRAPEHPRARRRAARRQTGLGAQLFLGLTQRARPLDRRPTRG